MRETRPHAEPAVAGAGSPARPGVLLLANAGYAGFWKHVADFWKY
jgi:hypothetical protein